MKKIYRYMIGILFGIMLFGNKVQAAEVRTANAVLYTNHSTILFAKADYAGPVILSSVDEGLPVKVTGITDNGFFQVDIAGINYYIPGNGLEQATAEQYAALQEMANLSTTIMEAKNSFSEYIQEVVRLVNVERQKAGLAPLELDNNLTYAACCRSVENAYYDNFSHTRPDGTSCLTVFGEYNRQDYRRAGENIAMRQKTPAEVVEDWMQSPGHKMNILGKFTKIGVGVAADKKGQLYWTQLFYY